MEKRGPKYGSECPLDLHLRLNEDDRAFLNSLGPASAQEKVIAFIHEKRRQQLPPSRTEIKMKLIEIGRRIKDLMEAERRLKYDLECRFNLSEEEIEKEFEEIQIGVHGEKR